MVEAVLSQLDGLMERFGTFILEHLPLSPFQQFYENWEPPASLGWLNWLFPVGFCLRVLAAWVAAIALYYLYSIIMRWIRVIT